MTQVTLFFAFFGQLGFQTHMDPRIMREWVDIGRGSENIRQLFVLKICMVCDIAAPLMYSFLF
jgi:hypothetical protein